jgi:biopolymer transport protein ExbD
MSRFKKATGKGLKAINTASLPDIVFMLLFFFMVTTVMRETNLKVGVIVPEATEVKKLEKKSLVSFIYIGKPHRMDENDQKQMTVSLKIDRNTKMGIVTEVKQELRKASALKINYSSRKKVDEALLR